jgi:adenylyltransferase/sulfurtransferase
LIGVMQATEALKIALGVGRPLMGRYFIYNALRGDWHSIVVERNPKCPLCGESPTIRGLVPEGSLCGSSPASTP